MNDDSTEKRMAGDYEIIQAVQIGDREVVLGENPQDETGMKYVRLLSAKRLICRIQRSDGQ